MLDMGDIVRENIIWEPVRYRMYLYANEFVWLAIHYRQIGHVVMCREGVVQSFHSILESRTCMISFVNVENLCIS